MVLPVRALQVRALQVRARRVRRVPAQAVHRRVAVRHRVPVVALISPSRKTKLVFAALTAVSTATTPAIPAVVLPIPLMQWVPQ